MGQKAATLRCYLGSPSAGRDCPELSGALMVGVGGFRLFQRVEIEDDVFDALVAQVSFERRHDAASSRQYRGANNIVRGGSPAGKELAVENAMQVGRNSSHVDPSPVVAAVAVHFEQMIPACDGFCTVAFRIGTAG